MALQEGLAAYAAQHAVMEQQLAEQWISQWQQVKTRAEPIIAGDMEAAEQAEGTISTSSAIQIELEEDDFAPIDED